MIKGVVIPGLDPTSYSLHPLHSDAAAWPETNCYADLWIGMLSALQLDPSALLPFTFGADFEGDQWTFLKPSLDDLWTLYGIDVQELNIWEALASHIGEQVARGRLPMVEVDSFYLPETKGTSYQIEHAKTTIGVNEIDFESGSMAYFHNSGYYAVEGDDFRRLLRIGEAAAVAGGSDVLAPYAEFAKLDRRFALPPEALREASLTIARRHLSRCPKQNPVSLFRPQFAADIDRLLCEPVGYYHKYAFATLRQLGAGFQLAAAYIRWLEDLRPDGLSKAAVAFDSISDSAKALLFKLARAVNTKKTLPYEAAMDTMEEGWQCGFSILSSRLLPGC